uniref:MBD domain-containing protein n=1 Tax=Strigamia maritima TaxID=126957 RepID=T1IHV3_STRMM
MSADVLPKESQSKLDEVAAMYLVPNQGKTRKLQREMFLRVETPVRLQQKNRMIRVARVFKGVVRLVEASHVADDHDEAVASRLRPIQRCTRINLTLLDVKDFKRNLISMGRIDRANYHMHIYHGMMKVYFKNTRQCLMHAKREDNNLYRILGEVITENQVVWENPADSKPTGRRVENYTVSIDMWHKRFGHMYAHGLNELAKNAQVKGLDLDSTVKDFSSVRKPGRNGFDREEVTRTTSGSVGRVDVYYYGPDGKRLRSRKEVKDYCTANGLTYEILDFDFSSNWPVTSTLLDDPVDVGIEDEDD